MHRHRLIPAARTALLVLALASVGAVPIFEAAPAFGAQPRVTSVPAIHPPILAALPPPPGTTSLVSLNLSDGFPSGPSAEASISANGRWTAFSSRAADLVPDDTNEAQDVFVFDRRTGRPIRLPLPGGGPVPKGGRAFDPSISADGNVVAFTYESAPGLTATVIGSILLAWDRSTGETTVVSRRPTSRESSVSGDGNLIAYTSNADGIVDTDRNRRADVFVIDRSAGLTTLVSIGPGRSPANGPSGRPSISANGALVAFDSTGSDLAPNGSAPRGAEVYVRDLNAATTELVSVNGSGGYANGASLGAAISADGHAVAFESVATDLASGDTNRADVFLRDRTAGKTTIVSVGLSGAAGNGQSGQAAISGDGRIVAFTSTSDDLVALADRPVDLVAVAAGRSEVYARDLVNADTIRISEAAAGGPGGGASAGPTVGGNGRYVAFASSSPALVANDDNRLADVFLRDLPPQAAITPAKLEFGVLAVGQPGLPLAAIVSNRGWGPMSVKASTRSGPGGGDFSILADGCKMRLLHRAESCTVSVGFTPSDQGTRTATLSVPGGFAGSPGTVRLVGVGSEAELKLDPPVGQTGIVTVVTGTGFPPGAEVQLTWSLGITPKLPKIVADANGAFRVQVLVFHRDLIGPRELIASQAGGPSFPPVQATMLVATPPSIPSSFGQLLPGPFSPPLIFRR